MKIKILAVISCITILLTWNCAFVYADEETTIDEYYIYERSLTIKVIGKENKGIADDGWTAYVTYTRKATKEDKAHGLTKDIVKYETITEPESWSGCIQTKLSVDSGYYQFDGFAQNQKGECFRLLPAGLEAFEKSDYAVDVSIDKTVILVISKDKVNITGKESDEELASKELAEKIKQMQGDASNEETSIKIQESSLTELQTEVQKDKVDTVNNKSKLTVGEIGVIIFIICLLLAGIMSLLKNKKK